MHVLSIARHVLGGRDELRFRQCHSPRIWKWTTHHGPWEESDYGGSSQRRVPKMTLEMNLKRVNGSLEEEEVREESAMHETT